MDKDVIRTCLATKQKQDKKKLWRFVIKDETLVFDYEQKMIGRGYYLSQDFKLLGKKYKIKKKVYQIAHKEIDKILFESS